MNEELLVQGEKGKYEVVIGLEVHAQVTSNAKLFSTTGTKHDAEPNSQVSLVDMAFPGMLPVINSYCVDQAIKTGLGINAKINKWSRFDRKNYFYPDLPQGYQISQFKFPIIGEGEIEINTSFGKKTICIERIHLEQDAGKLIHDISPTDTYVDLNRAGVALMEIVSKPDMRSAEEAGEYFSKLRMILRYLGTCDGNMEQGSMRADVNVSIRKPGEKLGTRTETKNVNSIKFMKQAIEYEIQRQIALIEEGKEVDQETRLFDPVKGVTKTMRSKEEAHDYRYFPDPDLPPLILSDERIEKIKSSLPELIDEKNKRFQTQYGLSEYDADILSISHDRANFFENVAKDRNAKIVANWMITELFALLNKNDQTLEECKITPTMLGELVDLLDDGTISGKIAKDIFAKMFETGEKANDIVEKEGLRQVSNEDEILQIVKEIINENPKQAEMVKEKPKALGWFVGQVMAKTKGKANPAIVNKILKELLLK